jgi:hypothetical protein
VPSQFSAIGFEISSGEDLASLAGHVAERADTIYAQEGQYLKWAPPSGEQLWLQVTHNGDAMGLNPHFSGKSVVRVALEARIARESHTPLDGTFLAWANPPDGAATGGDYPFVFDCPDAATCAHLSLPLTTVAQVAAFAQQVSLYPSKSAHDAAQTAQGMSFDSRSFIPSGLISPAGQPVEPPEPHALISGHVLEAETRHNSVTGRPFQWALIETIGGTFDVVADLELLREAPRAGNVLSGWFWLSGRLQTAQEPAKVGWFRKWVGR